MVILPTPQRRGFDQAGHVGQGGRHREDLPHRQQSVLLQSGRGELLLRILQRDVRRQLVCRQERRHHRERGDLLIRPSHEKDIPTLLLRRSPRHGADHRLQAYLAPIPALEINKAYGMTQNPGW